jgi:hypothetical protein
MTKVYEIFMGNSRLLCLSLTARIIFLFILVCEISLLQVGGSMLSGILSSLYCPLFLANLTIESRKVILIKVADNFLIFPTI